MIKTAEFVSLGHPDKTADYITSYVLDRLIEKDPNVKYGTEVMIKGNTVVLGGEVTGNITFDPLVTWVKDALREIGYNERYATLWGNHAIDINKIKVINLIGVQSPEINQGVQQNGWGDQGIFVGYATKGPEFLPKELYLARKLAKTFYDKAKSSENLGLDIKAQITLSENGHVQTAILAIPMREPEEISKEEIRSILEDTPEEIIINGTGSYKLHSSIADCGITGRKLAVDFYGAACPIGGGSPWTKDPTKADLTLNLYARRLAVQYLKANDECFVYLSSCIGRSKLPSATLKTIKDGEISYKNLDVQETPIEIIRKLNLNKPIFASLCQKGLMIP